MVGERLHRPNAQVSPCDYLAQNRCRYLVVAPCLRARFGGTQANHTSNPLVRPWGAGADAGEHGFPTDRAHTETVPFTSEGVCFNAPLRNRIPKHLNRSFAATCEVSTGKTVVTCPRSGKGIRRRGKRRPLDPRATPLKNGERGAAGPTNAFDFSQPTSALGPQDRSANSTPATTWSE